MFNKKLIFLILLFSILISCEYENAGINSVARTVSYSGDIAPLMRKNCALTGCHLANASTGNFNDYTEIKSRIDNGKFQLMVFDYRLMPPATNPSLTEMELAKLKRWIDEGALQN